MRATIAALALIIAGLTITAPAQAATRPAYDTPPKSATVYPTTKPAW